ncbi:MAG: CDP-diacylglycerol--glycerol-3-phosphate 3-phosphatidyltransferase [Oscillospiraceae bacterium]|nr:CDP-diacylglycerol--glycerol-3-phosphate 3-phosphatidyltransferase [Oscillospiraceae bacterium]
MNKTGDTKRENIWNIPNMLTMLRIGMIGLFVLLFVQGKTGWALAVFLIAFFTDMLDGYIARKYNLITDFGKLMDPTADKLMTIAALLCLTLSGYMRAWVVATVLAKEVIMIVGASLLLRRGIVVQAHKIGKAATMTFVVAIAITFFHESVAPWDFALQCLAVALALWALVHYVIHGVRLVSTREG